MLGTKSGQMKDASVYTQTYLWLTERDEKQNTERVWQAKEDFSSIGEKEGGAETQQWDAGIVKACYFFGESTLIFFSSPQYSPSPHYLFHIHSMNLIHAAERKGRKFKGTKKTQSSKEVLSGKEDREGRTCIA